MLQLSANELIGFELDKHITYFRWLVAIVLQLSANELIGFELDKHICLSS